MRPRAIERAVENPVSNAGRFGSRVELRVIFQERSLRIVVEDDGPGIPPDRRDEALRPFTRLEEARDPNRGAGGLGAFHRLGHRAEPRGGAAAVGKRDPGRAAGRSGAGAVGATRGTLGRLNEINGLSAGLNGRFTFVRAAVRCRVSTRRRRGSSALVVRRRADGDADAHVARLAQQDVVLVLYIYELIRRY